MTRPVIAIELAPDFSLDASEAVTQTYGVIAAKGGGKSYLASKFAEGLYDAGAPFVALDPVGNWSSLTLGEDGKSPGLSIVVIGGERADVPLVPEHGDRLGTFLVSQGLQAVIDLSELSKSKRKTFVADLCEAMYREARTHRQPFMVIFEEAQVFAPQASHRGEERMLGAVTDIVRLGRNYGLGSMLVTQRPQSVSKEVLNQVEVLCVGQLRGPQERKAIQGWVVEQNANVGAVVGELPSLEQGEFCVWSPSWLRMFKRVRIGKKRTFDGSSTPKLGAERAAILKSQRNIAGAVRLLEKLSAPEEVGERDADQGELSFELEAQRLANNVQELIDRTERLEAEKESLWRSFVLAHAACRELREALGLVRSSVTQAAGAVDTLMAALDGVSAAAPPAAPVAPMPVAALPEGGFGAGPRARSLKRPLAAPRKRPAPGGTTRLDKPASAVLGVLAQHGGGAVPRARLAMLAGYSPRGGAFGNCLSRLRVAGWITGSEELSITRDGLAVAPKGQALPTGAALVDYWRTHPRMDTPMRTIYGALVTSRRALTKEELGKRTGYSHTAGAFNNAISRLRVLGIVHGRGKEPLRLDATLEAAAKEAA